MCPPSALDPYEWVEAGKGYREWLVPADLVNGNGIVRVVCLDEEMAALEATAAERIARLPAEVQERLRAGGLLG